MVISCIKNSLAVSFVAGLMTAPALAADSVAVTGANILDGTGAPAQMNAVLVIEDGRIACIGSAADCPVPDGASVIDQTGKWITPGLVDSHVHFGQTGWIDGRPDGLYAKDIYPYPDVLADLRDNPDRWHRAYLCSGITAVYDVGGHQWTIALEEVADGSPDRVHVRTAGPLVTHVKREIFRVGDQHLFLPMDSDENAIAAVRQLKAWGSGAVKVWHVPVPPERQEELDGRLAKVGAEAKKLGMAFIVHAQTLREAKAAVTAGAELLVHNVGDKPVDDEFIALMQQYKPILTPTLLVGHNSSRARAGIVLQTPPPVDDPNHCVDPGTLGKIAHTADLKAYLPASRQTVEGAFRRLERSGASVARQQASLKRLYDAGVTIATGTDAGNPMTLHGPSIYAEMEAMQAAGIPARDVVVMSTRNAARAMRLEGDIGTLEPGKVADLVILAENPAEDVKHYRTITHVMRAGHLHTIKSLAFDLQDKQ